MGASGGIRAGRAFVELGVDDRMARGLRNAQRRLQAFGAGVRAIGTGFTAIGGAVLAPLGLATRTFARAGDELDKMSARTGISVEALSEMGFAAEQAGSDLGTLERGVRAMQRAINDLDRGLSTQVDAFGALGISISDLEGLSPEAQFKRIADGLSRVEDASQRAAIAQQIFGRSGTRLLPLISAGAAGVEELQQQARSLGLTISTQTARDAANFTNQMNILRKVLRITSITIGAALAPAMESIVARGTRIGVMITDWIRKNQEVVVTVARVALGVTLLGGALLATGLAIQVAAFAVGGLATAVTVVGAVVGALTSPLALATAGVAVLGFGFIRAAGRSEQAADVMNSVVGFLSRRFASLRETVNATIGGIGDALAAGDISLAARVLWNGIKVAFLDGTRDIQEIFAEGLTTLRLVFVDVLGGMTRTWFRFQSGIRGAQEETGSFLARQWVRIQGIFDEGLDVDRALKDLDDIARSNARNRDAALEQDLRDADRTQAARTQAVLELASEGIDRRSRALRRARDELEAALADARRQREASLAADTPDFIRRFSDLIDDLDNIGQDIVRRVEVRSTFNPALIGRLLGVGGDAVADRTARASEETARNTKRIAQSAESGGASFA